MRQRGGSSKTKETFLQTTALPGDIRSFESIDTSASKELDSKGFIFSIWHGMLDKEQLF